MTPRDRPKRPFVAVLGGAKISDKLGVVEALLDNVDSLVIGGAMCFTFLAARGEPIGDSLFEPDQVDTCRRLLDDRGMLDETLVVWMGEFGRTPKINKNESRDHWPQCWSLALGGGGVQGGQVIGDTIEHFGASSGPTPRYETAAKGLGHVVDVPLRGHEDQYVPC